MHRRDVLLKIFAMGAALSGFGVFELKALRSQPSWLIGLSDPGNISETLLRSLVQGPEALTCNRLFDSHFFVEWIDLNSLKVFQAAIESMGHSVILHPVRKNIAIVLPKGRGGGTIVDLESATMVGTISPSRSHVFWGHGMFSCDGTYFFNTEVRYLGKGLIVVRDGTTFQKLHEMETFGARPHELVLLDPTTAVVANGGIPGSDGNTPLNSQTNTSVLDLKTGKLLRQLFHPVNEFGYEISHVKVTSNGYILGSTFPNPTPENGGGLWSNPGESCPFGSPGVASSSSCN